MSARSSYATQTVLKTAKLLPQPRQVSTCGTRMPIYLARTRVEIFNLLLGPSSLGFYL